MIDELVPDPRYGAGYPRASQLLEAILAAGWSVTFFPLEATADEIDWMRRRFPTGVRVLPGNGQRALARLIAASRGRFDAVLVSRPDIARVFKDVCRSHPDFRSTYFIYDAEALIAPRERLRQALFGPALSSAEFEQRLSAELDLVADADAVVAVSRAEAEILGRTTRAPIHVIHPGPGFDASTNGFDARRDFLFVGRLTGAREASPNVDSLVWFVDDVMPRLDARLGTDYRVHVVGVVDSPDVSRLAGDRVILAGRVDDVRPFYDACRVFVAPTRFAAGLPMKVLEAFGAGIPCVVTPILAEQLEIADGRTALVGADADAFADACFRLYGERALWVELRSSALEKIEREYSSARFEGCVRALLQEVRRSSGAKPAPAPL